MGNGSIAAGLVGFPLLGAGVCYCIGRKNKKARAYAADLLTAVEFAAFLFLALRWLSAYAAGRAHVPADIVLSGFGGLGLSFTLDGFRVLYGAVASFMWMMTTIFSEQYFADHHNRNRYYFFMLSTLGATVGVFLAGDLYTLFVFFELMSFTSYVWVAQEEQKEALRAAGTYLAIAVLGGLVMLMGIFMLYDMTGTLRLDALAQACRPYAGTRRLWIAGICLLIGFGAKAGAFPLHVWLPKAHPVAPAPASALLSGILTKAGVFGIIITSVNLFGGNAGWGVLVLVIGVITMFCGAVTALVSVDLKRTLACSSMSQIGFILTGIGVMGLYGEGWELAARGSLLHMLNHSLLKLVLFLAAGAVSMNAHKLDLNSVRGFGHKKPLLHFAFLMGALGISGVPLWNGYISKSLLHEGILEYITYAQRAGISFPGTGDMKIVEEIFLISGGITFAYMLKLYVCLFIEKNEDAKVQKRYEEMKGVYMNRRSAFALAGSAVLLPIMGFFPNAVMDRAAELGQEIFGIAGEAGASYFTAGNLKGACSSLVIGALLYLLAVRVFMLRRNPDEEFAFRVKGAPRAARRYRDVWPEGLDLENVLYRPVLLGVLPVVFGSICRVLDRIVDYMIVILRKSVYRDSKIPHELEEGTAVTHLLGLLFNRAEGLLNATVFKKHPAEVDFEHKLANRYDLFVETNLVITRSLSFGLLLFCIGLLLTLAYLLAI